MNVRQKVLETYRYSQLTPCWYVTVVTNRIWPVQYAMAACELAHAAHMAAAMAIFLMPISQTRTATPSQALSLRSGPRQ